MRWRSPLAWLVLGPILPLLLGLAPVADADDGEDGWHLLSTAGSSAQSGASLVHAEGDWVVLKDLETEVVKLEGTCQLTALTGWKLQVGTLEGRGPVADHGPVPTVAIDGVEVALRVGDERIDAALTDAAADAGAIHDARFVLDGNDTTWSTFAVGPAATTASWGLLMRDPVRTEGTKHVPIEVAYRVRVRVQARGYGDRKPTVRLRLLASGHPDPMGKLDGTRVDAGLQGSIHRAIDAGVDYLLANQEIDGSWSTHQPQYPSGGTALAVYTLLKSGVKHDHHAIRRGMEFMRHHPTTKTYGVSTSILALVALGDPAHDKWIGELVGHLLKTQQGGWAYPESVRDMSCTQYAVLALRAAANHGVRIRPKVWTDAAEFAIDHMEDDTEAYEGAGFSYRNESVPNPTGSMTASGVGVLAICEEQLGRRFKPTFGNARQAGLRWLATHFDPSGNPHPRKEKPQDWLANWPYYYLYGVERVGSLLDLERFGPNDWYRQGAAELVEDQADAGSWRGTQEDTCFALLFLARATGASSGPGQSNGRTYGTDDPTQVVSLRASGGAPLNVWVSSFGTETLATYTHEGESGIRVDHVKYFAARAGEPRTSIGVVAGDAERASATERYPLRKRFRVPGPYTITAEVHVVSPETGALVVLDAEPVLIRVPEAFHPDLVTYAEDAGRNLIRRTSARVEASSHKSNATRPENTIDATQSTMWISGDEDPLPRITFTFKKPVKANAIAFTHAFSASLPKTRNSAKPRILEIRFNGNHEALRVELGGDIYRKTETRFPKTVSIRTLEIQVVERTKDSSPDQGVGFSEIELRKLPKTD